MGYLASIVVGLFLIFGGEFGVGVRNIEGLRCREKETYEGSVSVYGEITCKANQICYFWKRFTGGMSWGCHDDDGRNTLHCLNGIGTDNEVVKDPQDFSCFCKEDLCNENMNENSYPGGTNEYKGKPKKNGGGGTPNASGRPIPGFHFLLGASVALCMTAVN